MAQVRMADVMEALREINDGCGATAAEVWAYLRARYPTVTAVEGVQALLEAGVNTKTLFKFVRARDMAVLYAPEGSWLAEEAALSDFVNMTW